MEPIRIKDGIFWVGAIDWDRRLFDSLIPLPDGTSYNAYLIKGSEKTALIDTVDPSKTDTLFSNLKGAGEIHYVVAQHAEQDHSGSLPAVLKEYPDAKVVTSPKGKELLMDLLAITQERFITVNDNETLSLGDKTLQFLHTPWVHWPETISTYIPESRVLFTCDLFGSHLAASNIFSEEHWKVCEASKRYYAEVMMPFRPTIKKHIERFSSLDLDTIAPSHGPVHGHGHLDCIVGSHKEWVSDKLSNTAILAYASMHGSTELLADRLTASLMQRGVNVERFNLAVADNGKIAMALVDAATIVIGSPTVLNGAHPFVISAAFLANALRPKVKYASIIGSYGWGGRMVEQISSTISNLKVEVIEPVIAKGRPKEADLARVDELAEKIAAKHRELGVL